MGVVSAGWPVSSLQRSLSLAGWGALGGRRWQGVRSVLAGVVARVNDRSGCGQMTAFQIAEAAGLSERWARHCLTELEELGVIRWERGGIVDGAPAPSFITVIKTRLVELIHEAKAKATGVWRERRAATAERLAKLRNSHATIKTKKKEKEGTMTVGAHAELCADPPTPIGVEVPTSPHASGGLGVSTSHQESAKRLAKIKKRQEKARARLLAIQEAKALKAQDEAYWESVSTMERTGIPEDVKASLAVLKESLTQQARPRVVRRKAWQGVRL